MNDEISIIIVDDHGVVRKGLKAFLKNKPDIKVLAEGRDGQEAVRLCEQLQPQVVLMDLLMPVMSGVDALHIIHQRWPKIKVIALTSFLEKDLVENALAAGAIGYLLKNISGDDLAEAIRNACRGRPTLSPEVTQELVMRSRQHQPGDDLTNREREVLSLMVEGLTNPEIAVRLTISRSTARAHVSNILAKLGVSKRTEAISLALRGKLVK